MPLQNPDEALLEAIRLMQEYNLQDVINVTGLNAALFGTAYFETRYEEINEQRAPTMPNLPLNLELLIKLLKMTTSPNDSEALLAARKANEQLGKNGWDWENLLRGKVTIIEDPFKDLGPIASKPRGDIFGTPMKPRPPAPSRPTPPPPQTAPPPSQPFVGQMRTHFGVTQTWNGNYWEDVRQAPQPRRPAPNFGTTPVQPMPANPAGDNLLAMKRLISNVSKVSPNNRQFVESLIQQYQAKGTLTDKQWFHIKKHAQIVDPINRPQPSTNSLA